jgi:hypothetical protein
MALVSRCTGLVAPLQLPVPELVPLQATFASLVT